MHAAMNVAYVVELVALTTTPQTQLLRQRALELQSYDGQSLRCSTAQPSNPKPQALVKLTEQPRVWQGGPAGSCRHPQTQPPP